MKVGKYSKIIKYIGKALTLLTTFYLFIAIKKTNISIGKIDKELIIIAAIGSIIALFSLFILSFAWKVALEYLGNTKIDYEDIWPIYMKANIGKYLPGNVMHYIERNLFASGIGLSQILIAAGSILEIVLIVITALIMSFIFLNDKIFIVLINVLNIKFIYLLVIFGVLSILIFCICLFNKEKVIILWKEIKEQKYSTRKFIFTVLKILLLYAAVLFSYGFCFALIGSYIFGISLSVKMFGYLISCYILAWLAGYCIPGAPGGIGVREFVLILLAETIMGDSNILIAVVIQRLFGILGDILGYLLSTVKFIRRDKNRGDE
ncbi:MAG: hypothetical protein GX235_10775 [Clostridiales bacterium]|nr:hypothetical protein [Clostridiales bacterium]